jgi:hypothetical protein
MPLVSITRLRVRSWRYFPIFLFEALRAARQAAGSKGRHKVDQEEPQFEYVR